MLQHIRERLVLLLIGLLPFHALFVTVLTKLIKGPGNAPWSAIALWKEAVLAAVLCIVIVEIYRLIQERKDWKKALKIGQIDVLILAFFGVTLLVTLFEYRGLKATLLGVKYDLVPLATFLLLRRVEWSGSFLSRALRTVLLSGLVVSVIGLLTTLLPITVFTALGYSDLHSLYLPSTALAAFQQIGESDVRRVQSTFSGPNQLGLWLLLPFAISFLGFLRCVRSDENVFFKLLRIAKSQRTALCLYGVCVALIGTTLFFTFSRSAWMSALVIVVLSIFLRFSTDLAQRYLVRLIAPFLFGFAVLAIVAPQVVFRKGSTADHFVKPLLGIHEMASHPFGKGLGAAGPASNHTNDACVFLDIGADTTWAADRQDLCVIVGGVQMQPDNRVCSCPFVTENWYIQIGVELGFLGFFLYLCIVFFLLQKLWRETDEAHAALLYAFLGVSVAGLFLHSWEDAALAYTLWILLAVELKIQLKEPILIPETK